MCEGAIRLILFKLGLTRDYIYTLTNFTSTFHTTCTYIVCDYCQDELEILEEQFIEEKKQMKDMEERLKVVFHILDIVSFSKLALGHVGYGVYGPS